MPSSMTPKDLCDQADGQAVVARWAGVSRAAVHYWYHNLDKVPADFCTAIEQNSDGRFTRERLRPDIFGPIKTAAA